MSVLALQVLGRPGCHLCEALHAELARAVAGRAVELRVVDVDRNPLLQRRFGTHLPVVRVDGAVLMAHRFDGARLEAALSGARWEPLELTGAPA